MKPNIGRCINRVVVEVPGHQQDRWIGKKSNATVPALAVQRLPGTQNESRDWLSRLLHLQFVRRGVTTFSFVNHVTARRDAISSEAGLVPAVTIPACPI